jgi:polysaccharide pyruvyl transferase WcaK-like protein
VMGTAKRYASGDWRWPLARGSRVLLLGGYGVRNVGDEAILDGLLNQLPPGVEPAVISRNPAETRRMHGIRSIGVQQAPFELVRSDMLIVGGGGLFSSDTGPFGRFIPAFCRLARVLRTPVVFHGLGVYPSTSPRLLRNIARLAPDLVALTVRDSVSVETLADAGIEAQLVPDLSYSMRESARGSAAPLFDELGLKSERPTVGVCLTAIDERLSSFVIEAMPALVDTLPEVQFCFVPMSQHPSNERHNDLHLARQLRERCPRLTVVDGWYHPAIYLDLFRRFDAAICSRFHSFLFADRVGTPIVPLPYSEKCFGWLQEHDLDAIPRTERAVIEGVQAALEAGNAARAEVAA